MWLVIGIKINYKNFIFVTIFIAYTIDWTQVKQQGGNTEPPINRKLD